MLYFYYFGRSGLSLLLAIILVLGNYVSKGTYYSELYDSMLVHKLFLEIVHTAKLNCLLSINLQCSTDFMCAPTLQPDLKVVKYCS